MESWLRILKMGLNNEDGLDDGGCLLHEGNDPTAFLFLTADNNRQNFPHLSVLMVETILNAGVAQGGWKPSYTNALILQSAGNFWMTSR